MSRRGTSFFALAVAVSFTLHGALLLLLPVTRAHRSKPRLETVSVDLLGTARPEPPRAEAPAQEVRTTPEPSRASSPPASAKEPPSSKLPATGDKSRGLVGSSKPPDPRGGASEATLSLGNEDPRYRDYLARVRAAIFASWRVGSALLVAGGPRKALLRFTLERAGIVGSQVEVVRSSGNSVLDQRAVEGVQRAAVPPFPDNWTLERLNLFAEFEVVFQ